jgi:molybdopterin converting factor small subunit
VSIRVEFYGIPRQRAGVAFVEVDVSSLGEALAAVCVDVPDLVGCCIENGRLLDGYLANINGQRFTTDPSTSLQPGDSVLILSADVGG